MLPRVTTPVRDPTQMLASAWDPRQNAMTVLRLVLAAVVAITHALQLGRGWQPVLGPATELSALAVDGFFVLSGFLVAHSMLRLHSVRRYAWHRFLRIMPGFWACLLVTAFLIVPLVVLLSGGSPAAVLRGDDTAPGYVVRNALLLMRQHEIQAVPTAIASTQVVDGALWTLVYEAVCYAIVAALGLLGLLARRRLLTLGLVIALQAATILQAAGIIAVPQDRLLRLTLLFLLGVAALLFADRVPTTRPLVIAAVVLLVVAVALLPDYRALGAAPLAYLLLVVSAKAPLRWTPRWDLSYGLYIYHWPLCLLLLAAGAGSLPLPVFLLALTAVVLLVAAGSWLLIEAPAMRLRSAALITAPLPRLRRRRPAPRAADDAPGSR